MSFNRKPNDFDQLLLTETTTYADVATLFGTNYDANRFGLQNAGWVGNGVFVVILGGRDVPGGVTAEVYGNAGGYLRVEREAGGRTVGLEYSTVALADDPGFEPDGAA